MKNLIKNIVCMTFLGITFAGLSAKADIYQQDFDSWTGAPQSSFTNSTDSSGWSATHTRVYESTPFFPPDTTNNCAYMEKNPDDAELKSPLLTNGIGTINFKYGVDASGPVDFDVQISGDGSNWTTLDSISLTSPYWEWEPYSKTINHYSNLYFRVNMTGTRSSSVHLCIDSINITKPEPDVVITNTTVIPEPGNIYDDDEVTVITAVEQFGDVQNIAVKAYWKKIGGTWAFINMTNTTGNAYAASSTIPEQIAGTKVEYYVEVTFTGTNSTKYKYSPEGGASSPDSYTVQTKAFTSQFDSMSVDIEPVSSPPGGPQTVTMYLDADEFRQGVSVKDGYLSGITVDVEATTTNAIVESYGITSSNNFSVPLDTNLVLDGNTLTATNNLIQQILFRIYEDDMSMYIEECRYMDFTGWPTTSGYTNSTYNFPDINATWKAYNTLITTDDAREFRGKAAYLNSSGATSYVRSPEIANSRGIGELTFWYRNFTDSGVAASFDIQVSETGGTSDTEWTTTITNVTEIYTVEYLRFTVLRNDRVSKYIRIKNTGDANLCVDDIVIGYAPAGVVLDNIVADPENPNVLDSVYMYADITALKGAQNIAAKVYYRFGTDGNYKSIGMINRSGNTYDAASPFPTGCNGTLQYYFEVQFDGSRGRETTYYPLGAGENPYELVYTDISFTQNFESWNTAPESVYSNITDSSGWSTENSRVYRGTPLFLPRGDYDAWIHAPGGVMTPLLENGIGTLSFYYGTDSSGTMVFNIQTSSDGIIWTTIDSVSYSGDANVWVQYFKLFMITDSVYLRINMVSPINSSKDLVVDDIVVTLPSAMVDIGTQTRTPAYVSYNEPVDINCLLSSATTTLPAIDIRGKIFYRKKGSTTFSYVDMVNTGSGNYLGTIPAGVVESGDTIEYYIQSDFKGYAYTNSLNFSPTYSPDGRITQGSSYYASPTNYFEYDVRRFVSDVATMVINMTNDVDSVVTPIQMSLYSDEVWQGIISMGDYEKVFLNISAGNIKINTASTPTNIVFGDGTQIETTPPIVATAKAEDPSIEITGVTNQQYVVRLDMETKEYVLLACDSQNFDEWFLDSQYYAVGQNSQGGANKWAVDFENWPVNNQRTLNVNFNDDLWVNPNDPEYPDKNHWTYPDENHPEWTYNYWAQYSYQIWNTKLYNNPTNNTVVAQMQPSNSQGFMFPSTANPIHDYGVGTVSFKYKIVDTNSYKVLADMTLTNSFNSEVNYGVTSYVKGFGENFDDGDYHAIRLRQVDEFNYVEGRVVQTKGNKFYLEIWLCEAGILTRKYIENGGIDPYGSYNGYNGSLEEGGILIGRIEDDTANNVKVTLSYASKGLNTNTEALEDKIITAPALYQQAAPYGFAASGANMIVSSYSVNDYDNSQLPWWEESFDEGAFSVMQFDANWVHVVTTNDSDIIDGRMQRMGVGDLSVTPSTGLAVSIDPGDSTINVPDHQLSWIKYSYNRGLTNLYYKEMVVNVNTADHAFAIINRSITGLDQQLPIRFYDIEITGWVGDVLTQNDWVNNYGWIQSENSQGKYIELRRSKTPALERQYIASPRYTTLGSFGFSYMIPSGSALPTLKVWKATNLSNPATWVMITDSIVRAEDARDEWLSFSRSVVDENDGVLIFENVSAAGSDAIIRLDNITIYPSGGGSDTSWAAYNARLTGDEKTFEGMQSGFLNLNSTLNTLDDNDYDEYDPYIRTPKMNNGIGEISFWYAMLTNNTATLTYAILRVEKSDTGEDYDWDLLAEFDVSSEDYLFFSTNIYDTVSKYIRFSNVTSTNGVPQRLALDDLLVIDPYATSLDVQTVRTVPEQPLNTDLVKVQADLTNYKFGPYDISPVAYYYYTTNAWGKWTTSFSGVGTLEMELIATDTNVSPAVYTYQTIDSIPSNAPNTCVQYYVSVSYDGEVFANKTSPRIFRQALTNPSWYNPINYYTTYGSSEYNNPYYIVYSCPPGAVWFNEVNVQDGYIYDGWAWDTGTNGYIELTGKTGTDISGWSLEMYNQYNVKVKTFTIGGSTVLPNDNNGYGFFVFGAPDVQNKDYELSYDFGDMDYGDPNYIKTPGGLVLKRDFGAIEYKVCFNDSGLEAHGFTDLGDDKAMDGTETIAYNKSLRLIGTGSNYYDFAWSWEEGFTPGTVNTGQTITGGESNEFTITVTDYWFDGTTVYIVSEGTGDWSTPEVWYSTNLTVATPEWFIQGGVSYEGSSSVVTQWFTIPVSPSTPTTYYRIQGQTN